MARPRVFISSTFYDLKQVRSDVESFLKTIGHEAIVFERGGIPYSSEQPLDSSAYAEVDRCDILIAIIGGRYGSKSTINEYSITINEIKKAIESNLQVFFFVEIEVLSEFRTWEKNKKNAAIEYAHVDNSKVFEFLAEVYSLKKNNPVFPFSFSSDISSMLRDQFAGLFQSMLRIRSEIPAVEMMAQLKDLAGNLDKIVKSLIDGNRDRKDSIEQLIITNHPIFDSLKRITNTQYRVFFSDLNELDAWIRVRGFGRDTDIDIDSDNGRYWWHTIGKNRKQFSISVEKRLFDSSGKLLPIHWQDWSPDAVILSEHKILQESNADDDIPF
jgi:hypothetical protein